MSYFSLPSFLWINYIHHNWICETLLNTELAECHFPFLRTGCLVLLSEFQRQQSCSWLAVPKDGSAQSELWRHSLALTAVGFLNIWSWPYCEYALFALRLKSLFISHPWTMRAGSWHSLYFIFWRLSVLWFWENTMWNLKEADHKFVLFLRTGWP